MIGVPNFRGFVRTFVFICVGVFVLEVFARNNPEGGDFFNQIIRFFGIVPELFFRGMVYQVVTWVFFHGDTLHLLLNMLAFWMFGSLLQDYFGEKKFILFCLIAAVGSGLIVASVGLLSAASSGVATIGASGVVFAILIAISRLFPDQVVLFMFIFPMKMRTFAYLLIAMEFFALWQANKNNPVSNIAHLGGAVIGWIYISFFGSPGGRSSNSGDWWKNLKDKWRQRRMRKRLRVVRSNETQQRWN